MLSRYILPGDRIELTAITRKKMNEDENAEKKIYVTKVGDVVSEDRLEVVMPMEKTKLTQQGLDEFKKQAIWMGISFIIMIVFMFTMVLSKTEFGPMAQYERQMLSKDFANAHASPQLSLFL